MILINNLSRLPVLWKRNGRKKTRCYISWCHCQLSWSCKYRLRKVWTGLYDYRWHCPATFCVTPPLIWTLICIDLTLKGHKGLSSTMDVLSLRSINPWTLPIFSHTFNDSLSLLVFYLCRLPVSDCTFCEVLSSIQIMMWGRRRLLLPMDHTTSLYISWIL